MKVNDNPNQLESMNKITDLNVVTELILMKNTVFPNINIPYIGNFSHREILTKIPLRRCVKFSMILFSLFQGESMKTCSRVNFSLCLFLAISERSRTQRKLNPREKFPIYGKH